MFKVLLSSFTASLRNIFPNKSFTVTPLIFSKLSKVNSFFTGFGNNLSFEKLETTDSDKLSVFPAANAA